MKKKKILKLIAASTIIVNCAGVMANAQTDKNVQGYNVAAVETKAKDSVTLQSGKQIKAVVLGTGEVEIQENDVVDADQWSVVENIGKVTMKDIEENSDGSYTVTYLKGSFRYTRIYGSDSSQVQGEKITGAEVLNYDFETLTVDFSVDESNCLTTISTPNGGVEVKNFIPTLVENMGDRSICMLGIDKSNNTSAIVITDNKKVIQSKDVAAIMGNDYSEVRSMSVTEVDEERFLVLGYGVKASNSNHKDGFAIQFDGQGNKDKTPIKIIPASAANKYDATIKSAIKFTNGSLLLNGENLGTMYINALDYNDPRTVKESLKLVSGKTYEVVESETMTLSTNNTYTVKCVDGDFEYDIKTYRDVKDVKLVPGNDGQVLVAVQKDDTTEIGVINSEAEVKFDDDGDAVNAVTNTVVVNDNSGNPILNIDINTIKVEASGQVVLKKEGQTDIQQVTVQNVKEGNPVEVTKPEVNEPTVPITPPSSSEEVKPSKPGEQPPTGDGTEENNPTVPPVKDEEVKPSEPSDAVVPPVKDEEVKPSEPSDTVVPPVKDEEVKPSEPSDTVVPPVKDEEVKPSEPSDTVEPPVKDEVVEKPNDTVETKPENNSQVVNIDNGEKVVFDVSKPNDIKIVSSKLANKEVSYIVVNGVKVTKASKARLTVNDILVDYNDEYYTVGDGEITLSAKLFEALNLNANKGYNVGVGFADGEEIETLTTIDVIDVMKPVEKPGSDSETIVTKPSNNDSVVNVDKEEEVNEVISEKTPKTGAASGLSLIAAMMSSAVGAVLSRKKK